jgi:hypothetical protein
MGGDSVMVRRKGKRLGVVAVDELRCGNFGPYGMVSH